MQLNPFANRKLDKTKLNKAFFIQYSSYAFAWIMLIATLIVTIAQPPRGFWNLVSSSFGVNSNAFNVGAAVLVVFDVIALMFCWYTWVWSKTWNFSKTKFNLISITTASALLTLFVIFGFSSAAFDPANQNLSTFMWNYDLSTGYTFGGGGVAVLTIGIISIIGLLLTITYNAFDTILVKEVAA